MTYHPSSDISGTSQIESLLLCEYRGLQVG